MDEAGKGGQGRGLKEGAKVHKRVTCRRKRQSPAATPARLRRKRGMSEPVLEAIHQPAAVKNPTRSASSHPSERSVPIGERGLVLRLGSRLHGAGAMEVGPFVDDEFLGLDVADQDGLGLEDDLV